MKDETLGKIIMGSYLALSLAWAGLYIDYVIVNRTEDKKATAKVFVNEGTIIGSTSEYVAFDRDNDGEIDEIKAYSRCMVGMRCLASIPYTTKIRKGSPGFDRMRDKYFPTRDLPKAR